MARAQSSDFLQSMRFHMVVVAMGGGGAPIGTLNLNASGGQPHSGFANVTTPDVSAEATEYREGTYVYARKFPGNASMGGEINCRRGVTYTDTSMWDWMRVVIEGSGEYRADLQIKQYGRDKALTRPFPATGTTNLTQIDVGRPAKTYHIYEAFPSHIKPAEDFDATSSEVSISDMDFTYEHYEIESHHI